MIGYWIYWINPEIAAHYANRAEKIVELFREYRDAKASQKELLARQIRYITETIPSELIDKALHKQFGRRLDYRSEKSIYIIQTKKAEDEATLMRQNRRLMLMVENSEDTVVSQMFEALASVTPHFLAVDFHFNRAQWIVSKIEKRKFA
ncbi:sporulation inhibitor of replication protein SirA [Bacillus alveayuensis]|jgi:ATP-dependent exoDNAse (exonuclease V) beta subunit|uniref:sporulation inhibitor of replication protein SirA n=1 Tax=Aeribacillus alveayuensis TaxID=279215 RepID=UPI0005D0FDD7|nr:sporulation inhibitor of replication protein SirA [Bacillus alveayuensis]